MSVLLIELETKGHHISSYLRSIVTKLKKNKEKIIFLTTKEIKKNHYYNFFKKNTKIVYIDNIKYPKKKNYISLIKFQFQNYQIIKKEFSKIIIKNKINFVYINTLDFLDKPLSILGSPFGKIKFSGLYLNPKFYIDYENYFKYLVKKKFYFFLFKKILKISNLSNIYIVDPLCNKFLLKQKRANFNKISFINDLGSSNEIKKLNHTKKKCRKILNIRDKDYVILIYGYIRRNKSLNELFNVVNAIKSKKKIKILIVGKRDEETRKFIKNKLNNNEELSSKIINIEKFADDLFEKIVFKASDLVWTGYTKDFYGSSGVYFLASVNFTPVICSNHGSIGWYSNKFNIGYSLDLTNKKKLLSVLNKVINNKKKINYDFNIVNSQYNFIKFGNSIVKRFK